MAGRSSAWGPAAARRSGGTLLSGLFAGSDREIKTDVQKLGVDRETGLPMYAYRYKGDPKNSPKVVGPMAQDIEKVAPETARKVGGKRVVNTQHPAVSPLFAGLTGGDR